MLTLNEFVLNQATPEWSYMVKFAIPLAPSVLMDFEVDVEKTFHATDLFGLEDLVSLQNKQIDISTFTRGSSALGNGLQTDTDVIVQLSGKSSFNVDMDFYSKVDRNGRRWYSPRQMPSFIKRDFRDKLIPKIIKKFPQLKEISDKFFNNTDFNRAMPTGRDKQEFIKFYFTEAKKLLTKKFLTLLVKSITASKSNNPALSHNEILLHKFKIDKVWIVSEVDDFLDVLQDVKKLGLKSIGVIKRSEIKKIGV